MEINLELLISLRFLILLISGFYFINFCFDFNFFSADLESGFFLFFCRSLRCVVRSSLVSFNFSDINYYKVSFSCCFWYIPYILVCCDSISISLKEFSYRES